MTSAGWHDLCLRFGRQHLGYIRPSQNERSEQINPMKFLDSPRSGSYAGITSSRNRYGQYVRTRATPVNPASTYQQAVRGRMQTVAGAWRALTAVQQAGWRDLALSVFRTDSLGQSYNQTGFGVYTMVNMNQLASGGAILSAAPLYSPPADLSTLTVTATTSTMSFAYTVTPLPAGAQLFAFASPGQSAGRYFNGNYRLLQVGAAAGASPLSVFTAYQTRFGSPVTGQKIFFSASIFQGGWMSAPLQTSVII